jgi:hypothetical protein
MFQQDDYQALVRGQQLEEAWEGPEPPKMEALGLKYIRDFLAANEVPQNDAEAINEFLVKFYIGTCHLAAVHRDHAGYTSATLNRKHYLKRLSRVTLWLKDDTTFRTFEKSLDKIADFCLLGSDSQGRFVWLRIKQIVKWFTEVRSIKVKEMQDARKVNVGVLGARYAVQQIWVVCRLWLKERRMLKDRRGGMDGLRDEAVIS